MRLSQLPVRVVLIAAVLWSPAASAHSWYPSECCSNRDCMPADGIEVDVRGDLQVRVGTTRIWIPRGFATRASPDNRMHICYHIDDFTFAMPLCLFVPAGS